MSEAALKHWGDTWNDGDYIGVIADFKELFTGAAERSAAMHGFPESPYIPPQDGDYFNNEVILQGAGSGISLPSSRALGSITFNNTTGETFRDRKWSWTFAQTILEGISPKFVDSGASASSSGQNAFRLGTIPNDQTEPKIIIISDREHGIYTALLATKPTFGAPNLGGQGFGSAFTWPGRKGWQRSFTRWIWRPDLFGIPGQLARIVLPQFNSGIDSPSGIPYDSDSETKKAWTIKYGASSSSGFPWPLDSSLRLVFVPISDAQKTEMRNNAGLVYKCVSSNSWVLAGKFDSNGNQVGDDGRAIYPDDVSVFPLEENDPSADAINPLLGSRLIAEGDIIGTWIPNQIQEGAKRLTKVATTGNQNFFGGTGKGQESYILYVSYRRAQASGAQTFPVWDDLGLWWDEHGDGSTNTVSAQFNELAVFRDDTATALGSHDAINKNPPFPFFIGSTVADERAAYEKAKAIWGTNQVSPDTTLDVWQSTHFVYGTPNITDAAPIEPIPYSAPNMRIEQLTGVAASRHASHPVIYNLGLIGKIKTAQIFCIFMPHSLPFVIDPKPGYVDGDTDITTNVTLNAANAAITFLDTVQTSNQEVFGKLFSSNQSMPAYRFDVGFFASINDGISHLDEQEAFADNYNLVETFTIVDFSQAYQYP